MKTSILFAATALALGALSTAAFAMSTVPYSGPNSGSQLVPGIGSIYPDRDLRNEVPGNPQYDPRTSRTYGPQSYDRGGYWDTAPLNPNWQVDQFDRLRYGNPYPFDPIHNPYGTGPAMPYGAATALPYAQGTPPPSPLFGPNAPFAGQAVPAR